MGNAGLKTRGVERLIFSGGGQYSCPNRPTAHVMRDYAVAAGVLAYRIILDDTSRMTFGNLRHSLSIANSLGAAPDGSGIAIVTDGSHMTHTWLLTSYLGHHKAQLVTVDLFTKFSVKRRRTMIMREAAAWWYNLGKIMVWEALSLFRIPPEMRTRLVN